MKKTFASLLLLSSMAMAADYIWVGPDGGSWSTSSNWDIDNNFYPQSDKDTAIIGDDKSVIWNACNYFGKCDSVILGERSILELAAAGNINVRTFTIGGGSQVNWNNDSALGYSRDFTINYGTFTADSYGQFNVLTESALWYNGHTVTLTGTLDFANIAPGEGTINLYTTTAAGVNGFSIDYSGLNVINADGRVTYDIEQVDNGVAISYSVVPEPSTATLSLLALAGLASRRRRK